MSLKDRKILIDQTLSCNVAWGKALHQCHLAGSIMSLHIHILQSKHQSINQSIHPSTDGNPSKTERSRRLEGSKMFLPVNITACSTVLLQHLLAAGPSQKFSVVIIRKASLTFSKRPKLISLCICVHLKVIVRFNVMKYQICGTRYRTFIQQAMDDWTVFCFNALSPQNSLWNIRLTHTLMI